MKEIFKKFFEINLLTRLFVYFFFGILYLQLMKINSPEGIGWGDDFLENINTAVDNILNKSVLLKYGLTSYEKIEDTQNLKLYLIQAYYFLPYIIMKIIGGKFILIKFGEFFTRSIIISTGIIGAEISRNIFFRVKSILPNISSLYIYLLFISSPWTYRVFLYPYHDIYFFLFIFLSILFLFYKKKSVAIFLFFIGSFFHYQWSFLISSFYLILLLIGLLTKRLNNVSPYFPVGFTKLTEIIKLTIVGYVSSFIVFIQNLYVFYSPDKIIPTNTRLLYRIGIGSNPLDPLGMYHGGFIGAIEFLGGDRITGCFTNNFQLLNSLIQSNFSPLEENIANLLPIYSCILSISGMFFLSIISLIGTISFLKQYKKQFAWIFLPILFALLSFVGIFQQLWHTHLSYFSYAFSIIFAFGIVIFYQLIMNKLKVNEELAKIFSIPVFSAIIINSIRVSYLSTN